jgi:hypothetical protein
MDPESQGLASQPGGIKENAEKASYRLAHTNFITPMIKSATSYGFTSSVKGRLHLNLANRQQWRLFAFGESIVARYGLC